jgi:hypothetical protein
MIFLHFLGHDNVIVIFFVNIKINNIIITSQEIIDLWSGVFTQYICLVPETISPLCFPKKIPLFKSFDSFFFEQIL